MSSLEKKVRAELSQNAQGGQARLEYTRKAYHVLPDLERPRVLDVGCGRGGPTLELARLSGGHVTGLDLDAPSLDALAARAREVGLDERIQTLQGSMLAIGLPDGTFDVVWAEGVMAVIGFGRGLREWRRLIRPSGFLVVHSMVWRRVNPPRECQDRMGIMFPGLLGIAEHLAEIPGAGYDLLGHFCLPEVVWWQDYYGPLEARIKVLWEEYGRVPEARVLLEEALREVDSYRRCARWYGSAFFIMQRGERQ